MPIYASAVDVRVPRAAANRAQRGSAVLEFALSAVGFLAFLFSLISLAQMLLAYQTVSFAARQCARWAVVRGSGCATNGSPPGPNPPSWCDPLGSGATQGQTGATAADIQNYLSTIIMKGMTLNTASQSLWPGGGPNNCAVGSNSRGCPVRVYVSYGFTLQIPFFSAPKLTLNAHSEMMISQ